MCFSRHAILSSQIMNNFNYFCICVVLYAWCQKFEACCSFLCNLIVSEIYEFKSHKQKVKNELKFFAILSIWPYSNTEILMMIELIKKNGHIKHCANSKQIKILKTCYYIFQKRVK
jgi:hypothetical protein